MKRLLLASIILGISIHSAAAVTCYEAEATIDQKAPTMPPPPACTPTELAWRNTGKGPLDHNGCTAAKAQARQKLVARLQATCRRYVQTNSSCSAVKLKGQSC